MMLNNLDQDLLKNVQLLVHMDYNLLFVLVVAEVGLMVMSCKDMVWLVEFELELEEEKVEDYMN